jgi:branched-chain amino acid transport system ATP-binding protein
VAFGGVVALDDVDLEIHPACVNGLIGPNGAGKTTLFNVITGLQKPRSGSVHLDGRDITALRPNQRANRGVARTFQRLELFGSLTARENILTALEIQKKRHVGTYEPLARANELLERVGLTAVADEPADVLSTGFARLLELARALATSPEVLLLDEPSAGLNSAETIDLGVVLRDLAAEGLGVLLVEHDMGLVMEVCDNVTVLDFGSKISSGTPETVRSDPVVQAAYLGVPDAEVNTDRQTRDRDAISSDSNTSPRPIGRKVSSPVTLPLVDGATEQSLLAVEDVRVAYGRIEVVHGVSLTVARGSVTALLGPNGAGKSTLLQAIGSTVPLKSGRIAFDGHQSNKLAPERLAKMGLCSVPEGRPVFPNLTVAENLRMYTYRDKKIRYSDLCEASCARFPVLGQRLHQHAGTLSGGEQQMLALARVLYPTPRMLLLDELSMGLAPLVVGELYETVAELVRSEGVTLLLAEQFAATALAIADEAVVMVNGEFVDRGRPADLADRLEHSYLGD